MAAAEEQGQASDDAPELDLATWKLPDSTMKVNFVGKPTSYGSWGAGSTPYGSDTTNEYNEWEDTYRRSIPVSDGQVCLVGVRQVGLSDGFPDVKQVWFPAKGLLEDAAQTIGMAERNKPAAAAVSPTLDKLGIACDQLEGGNVRQVVSLEVVAKRPMKNSFFGKRKQTGPVLTLSSRYIIRPLSEPDISNVGGRVGGRSQTFAYINCSLHSLKVHKVAWQ